MQNKTIASSCETQRACGDELADENRCSARRAVGSRRRERAGREEVQGVRVSVAVTMRLSPRIFCSSRCRFGGLVWACCGSRVTHPSLLPPSLFRLLLSLLLFPCVFVTRVVVQYCAAFPLLRACVALPLFFPARYPVSLGCLVWLCSAHCSLLSAVPRAWAWLRGSRGRGEKFSDTTFFF